MKIISCYVLLTRRVDCIMYLRHYVRKALRGNPCLQYPPLHGPVHTPENNGWDTPPV